MNAPRSTPFLPQVLGVAFLLGMLWGALIAFIHHDRAQVEENAYRETENYAIAFEEYAHNIISNVDNALRYLGNVYLASLRTGQPIDHVLLDGYAPIKTFQFSVIGPDGILRYSNLAPAASRVDLSDREHFRVHVGSAEDNLFISRPILGRVSGKWSIQFTRKIVLPDGSFGGVLVLSLEKREFEDFFDRLDLGERGLIALFGMDGWMRARGTRVPEQLRSSATEPLPMTRPYFGPDNPQLGRIQTVGYYDGVDRMGAYRRVRHLPLVVSVQKARDEVFTEHQERAERAMQVGAALSLLLILGGVAFHILRRQRDAALSEADLSEERWRLAVDAVGDGVWDWNPQTGEIFFSQQMGALVGKPQQDLPRNLEQWQATIHPEDRERVTADFSAFLAGAVRLDCEYRAHCGDGQYRWIQDRAVTVARSADGRPLRVIGLRSDIAERRRLQDELARQGEEMRQLQAALAAREIGAARHRLSEAQRVARLGIIERDATTGLWTACEHAQSLLGLARCTDCSLDEVLANVASESRMAAAKLAVADLSSLNLELAVEQAGETRYLRAVGCAPANEHEHGFVTLQDISARRASEREHARLKERMEEANRLESLGTLAGGIAHEINTPAQYVGDNLAFIQNSFPKLLAVAETAGQEVAAGRCPTLQPVMSAINLPFLSKELPEAISQGIEGVGRIAKIVQAVKEFCYPSSREPQPCDLNHMIQSAATVTRNAWKYVAEMEMELAADLPAVDAIEGEINQILVNLIINSAQAIAEKNGGKGRIHMRTWRQDDMVAFSVADNGVGIPADRHKRIFELFYTTKPPGQGTGQGLAISSAIVRRHGGTITVDSQPGEGACFTVSLPIGTPGAEIGG
ncbi:MAG: ATP-binding protein [Bacteroidales bacterium]